MHFFDVLSAFFVSASQDHMIGRISESCKNKLRQLCIVENEALRALTL